MPQTIRKYWGPHHGRAQLNVNWSAIDHDSVVVVTASEYKNEHVRFVGAASITVANVAPHGPPYDPNHGVTFVVNVDWRSPLNIVTDITLLDDKPIETQTYVPPMPNNIGLLMQYQETGEWCWIAVATSISHFYNPASTWTQCKVITTVLQTRTTDRFPPNMSACPSADMLAANPGLALILADPYSKPAEFVLDNPAYGIDPKYTKQSGGVSDALKVTGNWASNQPGSLGLDQIASEVNAGRPVVAEITWFSGGTHFVAIAGVLGAGLLVLDPINGQSVIRFGGFPAYYFGGAKLDNYTFTKSAS
jgi:hypothetical protein